MTSFSNGFNYSRSGKSLATIVSAYTCLVLIFISVVLFTTFSVKRVSVEMDGKVVSYYTFAPTVSAVLREVGVRKEFGLTRNPSSLREGETLSYYTLSRELSKEVSNGTKITIVNNRIEKKAETRVIPMSTHREWDVFLAPGKQRIINPGRNGIIKDTVITYYRDGKLTESRKVSSEVVVTPQPMKLACGSYDVVSRQGPVRGGRAYKFEATAYTYTGYRTATGASTRRGIIAVDPRVIPLGTKLYVEGYGHGVAADTGGAIKGRRLDVFLETESSARKWGRRYVDVYILK